MRLRTRVEEAADVVPEEAKAVADAYVAMLEREYDHRSEAAIPTADDIAADFERFLREQRDDEG